MKSIDITGKKFNRWTVLEKVKSYDGKSRWLCECECGTIKQVVASSLKAKSGGSKSCGCYSKDNPSAYKHGLRNTRLYNIWSGMKTRCYNKRWHAYIHYGGKGINVCSEWKDDCKSFINWALNNGYSEELTIDRIDNSKDYSPINCRWVSRLEQGRNKTTCKLDYAKVKTIKKLLTEGYSNKEISDEFNVSSSTIHKISTGLLWG